MSDKNKILAQISELARTHNVTIENIQNHYADTLSTHSKKHSFFTYLFSYLGGGLIFAGLCTYANMVWDDFSSASRVLITLGSGLICLLLALIALKDSRYTKVFTPLMLIAVALQPLGLFVFLDEYMNNHKSLECAIMIVFGVLALQQGLLFLKYRKTSLAFFGILFGYGALCALAYLMNLDADVIHIVLSFSGLCLAYGLDKTAHRAIAGFWYFVSTLYFSLRVFWVLEGSFDFALIGVAALLIYASTWTQSRSFLFASIITLLTYLSYLTGRYFSDVTGWPIALIVLGALFIGISSYGIKLGQKMN